jgi:molybdopterin-containing oxidoreductase family iron-sulfur binding subunit
LIPAIDNARENLRLQLDGVTGPRFWRALDELVDQPAFRRPLHVAFPQLAQLQPSMDRRGFLKLLGASLAMAGLAACSGPPQEQIVPWVQQPEGMSPSSPQFYATTLRHGNDIAGVLVETHQGRPSKIEGNPNHPASLGATDAILQAAVLELWDPDRSSAPKHRGVMASWDDFEAEAAALSRRFAAGGQGLHVLSGRIDSPTLARQRREFLQHFPGARWHHYEAVDDDHALAGARLAFGTRLQARHHLDRAECVVALEADFLASMPGHLRHARDFAAGRKPTATRRTMNRLYAVEATPSLTGAKADHAWPLASARIGAFALELAAALGIAGAHADTPSGMPAPRVHALADDLRVHRGSSLLLAGAAQPPMVHALMHLLNQALGNVGRTVDYIDPLEPAEDDADSLRELVSAMEQGSVDTLLILDGNPAYATPAELHFATLLERVPHSIHLGLHDDETAARCSWHLPRAHALEAWSDARAFDGSASLVQPVIAPLHGGRSVHEVLAILLGDAVINGRDIVQSSWREYVGGDFDAWWERSLREGVIADSAAPARAATASADFLAQMRSPESTDGLELLFRPDPTVWDGRYANNGWLQECPKPLTQLTWSNAALVSPALAAQHGLKNGDAIELRIGTRHTQAPVWIMPGQATHSVTVALGYGRRRAGHVGERLGFDAHALRSLASPWCESGLQIDPIGQHVELATTQRHHAMEGRAPVRAATLAQFLADPAFAQNDAPLPPSLYSERPPGEYSWGMSVDLNSCIGCNACTVACQAENNIPVVGEEEVRRGREMHWIRVDRYYEGAPEAPRTHHQPVPCMHCEHAPCEVVCPVGATVHDSEGLNLQVYNRCVGTRFCSNNCPYKVRRFNFLQYADLVSEELKAQRNPDVSVRNRGVMEKCTYCIQRIETAHIAADKDDRRIADGEVRTACQSVCPTQAITFGNIADPASAVSREKASPRNYALLGELNTRPHTTYLASLRNPNPALEGDT